MRNVSGSMVAYITGYILTERDPNTRSRRIWIGVRNNAANLMLADWGW